MTTSRVESLRRMLELRPDDARLRFGLALEHERMGAWEEAVAELQRYLDVADDEGNAWGRLGDALRRLGRDDEARAAYQDGIRAARRHDHPSMAADFERILESWDD